MNSVFFSFHFKFVFAGFNIQHWELKIKIKEFVRVLVIYNCFKMPYIYNSVTALLATDDNGNKVHKTEMKCGQLFKFI